MSRRRNSLLRTGIGKVLIFGLILLVVCFGFQFFTNTGVFHVPGVVYYDESLSNDEVEFLKNIFTEDIDLNRDVTISAKTLSMMPELKPNEYLYEITVPVVGFMESGSDVTDFEEVEYIPFEELDFTKKLISINGDYYLDSFDKGANFRVIQFDSPNLDNEIKPLVDGALSKVWPKKDSVLTFAQTGVTALSRGMNDKLNAVGGDATFFSTNLRDYLSSFDLTHTSNESSFSESANGENICSDKRFVDTIKDIGIDIVELTGNHNLDCGKQSAIDTIDIYTENKIKIVGGGKNFDEASQPLLLDEKDNKITFLAYNLSTGGATTGDYPGANQYYEETAKNDISEAKKRGDFVIVDVQYYECSAYASEYEDPTCDRADSAAGDQIGFFRHLIDLGADIVVGTSAHQPQTYELYKNGVIYYGLGNLFFDQIWWPGTTRSLILAHYFYKGKLLQTKIVPTKYDASMQTELLDADSSKWLIQRLATVSPGE